MDLPVSETELSQLTGPCCGTVTTTLLSCKTNLKPIESPTIKPAFTGLHQFHSRAAGGCLSGVWVRIKSHGSEVKRLTFNQLSSNFKSPLISDQDRFTSALNSLLINMNQTSTLWNLLNTNDRFESLCLVAAASTCTGLWLVCRRRLTWACFQVGGGSSLSFWMEKINEALHLVATVTWWYYYEHQHLQESTPQYSTVLQYFSTPQYHSTPHSFKCTRWTSWWCRCAMEA